MNAQQIQHELNVAYAETEAMARTTAADVADGKVPESQEAIDTLIAWLQAIRQDRDIEAAKYAQELPF